jgi:hypothetical protein
MVTTTHPPPLTETPEDLDHTLARASATGTLSAADTLELSAEDTAVLAEVMDTPLATRPVDHLTDLRMDHRTDHRTASMATLALVMVRLAEIATSTTSKRLARMAETRSRGRRDLVVRGRPAVATDSAVSATIPAVVTRLVDRYRRIRAVTRLTATIHRIRASIQ